MNKHHALIPFIYDWVIHVCICIYTCTYTYIIFICMNAPFLYFCSGLAQYPIARVFIPSSKISRLSSSAFNILFEAFIVNIECLDDRNVICLSTIVQFSYMHLLKSSNVIFFDITHFFNPLCLFDYSLDIFVLLYFERIHF